MLRQNRLTLIVMGIALIAFVGIKVVPLLPDSKKEYSSGRAGKSPSHFKVEGRGWFMNASGDTLAQLELEIADKQEEWSTGLMGRKSMAANMGMLFIFDKSDYRSFWMKNTLIPLDIIYISGNGKVKKIYENTVPKSKTSLPSEHPVMEVVEVNAGYVKQYNIDTNSTFAVEYKR